MQLPDVEGVAADIVPGRGIVGVRLLSRGLHHTSYEVERDRIRYVLRVAQDAAAAANLQFEGLVWQEAHAAGLAPKPSYIDVARGVLLYQWVEGENWPLEDVLKPERIEMVARLIERIQALPIPACARRMSPADWVSRYRCLLPKEDASGASLARMAAACLQQLAALPALPEVLAHSDLHRLNLVAAAPSAMPKVLDWEYVHVTSPYWDVAGWSASNDFDAHARRDLLESYLQREAQRVEVSRLERLAWLYDYVCWLWIEVHARLAGGVLPAALAARARLLSTRMQARAPTMAN